MLVKSGVDARTRRQIDEWWMRWHLTFLFPPMYSGHTHVWKSINSECVGCIACGVVHLCSSPSNIVPCAVEQQDDTSLVCTYTGIVVNNSSFFDPETSIADYNAGPEATRMAIQEALEEGHKKGTPSFGMKHLEVIHRSGSEAGLLGILNFPGAVYATDWRSLLIFLLVFQ